MPTEFFHFRPFSLLMESFGLYIASLRCVSEWCELSSEMTTFGFLNTELSGEHHITIPTFKGLVAYHDEVGASPFCDGVYIRARDFILMRFVPEMWNDSEMKARIAHQLEQSGSEMDVAETRVSAIEALVRMAPLGREIVERIAQMMETDDNLDVRSTAIEAVSQLCADDEGMKGRLAGLLEEPELRNRAIIGLVKMAPLRREIVERIMEAIDDPMYAI